MKKTDTWGDYYKTGPNTRWKKTHAVQTGLWQVSNSCHGFLTITGQSGLCMGPHRSKPPNIIPSWPWRGAWCSGHHLWNRQDDRACLELTELSMHEKFQGLLTTTYISLHPGLPPHLRAVELPFRTLTAAHERIMSSQSHCGWRRPSPFIPGCTSCAPPPQPPLLPPQSLSLLKSWRFRCV